MSGNLIRDHINFTFNPQPLSLLPVYIITPVQALPVNFPVMDRISLPHLSSPQHYTREREVPLKFTCVLLIEFNFELNRNPDTGLSL